MIRAYGSVRKRYIEQEVMNAPPEKLVLMVYDLVLASLKKGDYVKARAGIRELIDSLDFERGGELATRFLALYEYALRQIHEGRPEEAFKIIKVLRDTWYQVFFGGESSGGGEDGGGQAG